MTTEAKIVPNVRQEERELLASIIDSSDDAILTKDMNGIITSWNKGAERIYGYTAEEVIGRNVSMLTPPEKPDEIPSIMKRLQGGERIDHYETERIKKDGDRITVSLTVSPVLNKNGKILGASAIGRDITQRKHAEEIIRSQLKEKKILLQEIYHRVKNNLQLISSLLELRARDKNGTELNSAFKDSVDRIRAMALVHEKMYQSDSLAQVDFKNYLTTLAKPLVRSYGSQSTVVFEIEGDKILLDVNTAVPLGLIFNELITNSLKYAFPQSGPGCIAIVLQQKDGTLILSFSDNGVGLPEEIDISNAKTFGFKIVGLLIDQLGGSIKTFRQIGTMFEIRLPYSLEENLEKHDA